MADLRKSLLVETNPRGQKCSTVSKEGKFMWWGNTAEGRETLEKRTPDGIRGFEVRERGTDLLQKVN